MTIPYITAKQQEIPKLIYKFRFLNRLQIQKLLNHKYHNRIIDWLNDLVEKEYIEKLPKDNTFEQRTKPTVYRIGINGIRFLKIQDDYSMEVIQKLYRDGKREEPFVSRCTLIADACLNLIQKSTNTSDTTFSFETQSDYTSENSQFHFLTETEIEPSLCFVKKKSSRKTYYLVDVFDSTLPTYRVRKRLRNYFEFYQSSEWENNTGKKFPIVLFICSTKANLIYAKRHTKKLLQDYQNPTDLHIRFATVDEVKKFGISGEIGEEVE